MQVTTSVAKGTADMYGDSMRFRQSVIKIIKDTFEKFGFEPLETPIIERKETLTGKYGDEAQNLIFWVPDYEVGLRYDHTVPLARFIANNKGSLTIPFKRYAIGPVFRGENTQAGRNRQFTQCDFDTVGSTSLTVDAEIVAINSTILTSLGFDSFSVQINDRRLLNAMVNEMGFLDPKQSSTVMNAWDKLDKMSPEDVFEYLVKQMEQFGITREFLEKHYNPTTQILLELKGKDPQTVLDSLSKHFNSEASLSAIKIVSDLISMIKALNVPTSNYELNPLLARGLSYYTGPIFETVIKNGSIGSVTGGGRFDNLIENLGGPSIAASGSSFGLERLLYVMEKLNLKPEINDPKPILVTIFDSQNIELISKSFEIATILRDANIKVEVYSGENTKIGNQIRYADRKGMDVAIVVGPDELKEEMASIKNLKKHSEKKVKVKDIVKAVQSELA